METQDEFDTPSDDNTTNIVIGKKIPKWITREIAEDFGRAQVLRSTFRESIVYVFFVSIFTIYAIGSRNSFMYYLTKALREQFLEREFVVGDDFELTFFEIRTATDFWTYLDTLLLDSMYWDYYYNDKVVPESDRMVLFENKLLGVPRMRQVRVRNDSCVIHEYFRRLFLSCYSKYTPFTKETLPYGPGVGTAWTYSNESKTNSLHHWGLVGTYDGSGYYVDFKKDKNSTKDIFQKLKDELWITRNTRAIFIDFSVYNANLNLFGINKMIFEFPPTGGVITSYEFHTVSLIRFSTIADLIILIAEVLFYVFITYYIAEGIREFLYFKHTFFFKFWTYIDLIIIVCSLVTLYFSIREELKIPLSLKHIEKYPNDYGNLEQVARLHLMDRHLLAINLFFVYLKIFKYLNFNRTMGQLNNTLKKCAMDILGFSIMFFIIFFAFAELGYLLFGSQVANFSTFGEAMFTLLRTILGDFDYESIERANRILAPIYFLSYIFLVFFVLLNMFLAIINDTYSDVKTEIAIAPDEMQMSEYVKLELKNILRKLGCRRGDPAEMDTKFNATIQQIQATLKKCGFSDLEIGMFFARYNIDPTAKVTEHDAAKLKQDLETAQPGGVRHDEGLVHVNDFIVQQERLEKIESKIDLMASRVQQLIKSLDKIEAKQKGKKQDDKKFD